ncbi:MAG: leucine-rich repeat protein, partial [Eubacteriales bacterium]|nr:leucine-rich repeat protein [Eubacteriales bacterium]
SAFYLCENLSDISFPASLASIGNNAFYRCILLKNVTIPDTVKNIGSYAFEYCSGLESVTIENGVESIGTYAFYGCTALSSVTMPVSIANISKYAFGYCEYLKDVYYDGSWAEAQSIQIETNNDYLVNANWQYKDKEVLKYSYDEENLSATVIGCAPFVESVEIPAVKEKGEKTYAVTTIGANAFSECTNLLTAIIYTKDLSIGENSFPEKIVVYGYHDIADIVKENKYEFKPLCELDSVDHSVITIEGCSPTCASEGLTDGSYCEYCAFVFTPQEVIEKLPHKPIIVPAVAPTCKTEGNTMGSICNSCGEVYVAVEVIDKLEHNTVCDNNAVEPDCENTGLTDSYSCTSCGEVVVEQTVVEALGHDYVVLQGKPATNVEEGLTDGIGCSKCDYVLIPQEIIPALSKLGDVNGDGEITITDATIIQRHVAKITELTDGALSSADVSKDGQVAVIDATMIQRLVAKIITDF